MPELSLIILYVEEPSISIPFYAELLDKKPIQNAPTYAMFPLRPGVMLGIWSRKTVDPEARTVGVGGEVVWTVADAATVDQTYKDWMKRGLVIAQEPVQTSFGRTFVALDPDGHRLRILASPAASS